MPLCPALLPHAIASNETVPPIITLVVVYVNVLTDQGLFAKKLDFLKGLRAQLDTRENAKMKYWSEWAMMRGDLGGKLDKDVVRLIAEIARDTADLPDCSAMWEQTASS